MPITVASNRLEGRQRIFGSARTAGLTLDYSKAILKDVPSSYWRFGEKTGTTAFDLSGSGNHGTYVAAALGGESSLANESDSSVVLSGSSACITTAKGYGPIQTFSIGGRFKTQATVPKQGIIGFVLGSSHDREIYMENGRLVFYTFSNGSATISTTAVYNDGLWHSFLLAFNNTVGRQLYVDGNLAASGPPVDGSSVEGSQWLIGKSENNGQSFAGNLDEFVIFPYMLSATQALEHYRNTK